MAGRGSGVYCVVLATRSCDVGALRCNALAHAVGCVDSAWMLNTTPISSKAHDVTHGQLLVCTRNVDDLQLRLATNGDYAVGFDHDERGVAASQQEQVSTIARGRGKRGHTRTGRHGCHTGPHVIHSRRRISPHRRCTLLHVQGWWHYRALASREARCTHKQRTSLLRLLTGQYRQPSLLGAAWASTSACGRCGPSGCLDDSAVPGQQDGDG